MIVPDFVGDCIDNILEKKRQNIVKKKWELVELQQILAKLQEQAEEKGTGQQANNQLPS